jgi:hypothetical protein
VGCAFGRSSAKIRTPASTAGVVYAWRLAHFVVIEVEKLLKISSQPLDYRPATYC